VTTAPATDLKPRHRRRWRLRVLLALEAVLLVLFVFSRLERSHVESWGSVALGLHAFLDPPLDMELSDAEKRLIARIRAIGGRALPFAQPTRLERLLGRPQRFSIELAGTDFGDDDLALLAKTWGPYIAHLNLRYTKVTDSGLRRLRGLAHLEQLLLAKPEFPTIIGGPTPPATITDGGLLQLRDLAALRELQLDGLPITDVGLRNLDGLPALCMLHLGRTQVRGDCLYQWKLLPQIIGLYLDNTPLTDDGLSNLARAPNLQVLSLRGVPLSRQRLTLIQGSRSLSFLDLAGTELLDKDLAPLRASMPRVTINSR
jgi:hypothetical protein